MISKSLPSSSTEAVLSECDSSAIMYLTISTVRYDLWWDALLVGLPLLAKMSSSE